MVLYTNFIYILSHIILMSSQNKRRKKRLGLHNIYGDFFHFFIKKITNFLLNFLSLFNFLSYKILVIIKFY